MLNITFIGTIYDSSGNPYIGNEVKYQLYFPRDNVWSSPRISQYGQYNINLGDSDVLGVNGQVSQTDEVIIAFWTPNTSSRTDLNLIEWGYIKVYPANIVNVNNVQLKPSQIPNISVSYDVNGFDLLLNVNADDSHMWMFNNLEHYQDNSIFPINNIDSILVDWGDGTVDDLLSHNYQSPGMYVVNISCLTLSGQSNSHLFNAYISYPLSLNLTWEYPIPNRKIKFIPDITGETNRIIKIEYYINGSKFYETSNLDPFEYFIEDRTK